MTFDFDKETDRRNTFSYKWDVGKDELPMWVADMDFEVAAPILEAMQKKLDEKIFGYGIIPPEWNEAYCSWWRTRHHFDIAKESLVFCTGVVPAISSAVRKLTTPAEKIALLVPTYNVFFNSIQNNGRIAAECFLDYRNGEYSINFERLETILSDKQTSLLILSNPQNPVGKIWNKADLAHIGALASKNNVVVISDEIHCDLTDPGTEYTPFASVNEECKRISITCLAPTKAFNLAGIQTAAIMAENPLLRHKMWRALNTDEVAEPNAFAICATIAAFEQGAPWLDALRAYIFKNKTLVAHFLQSELPHVHLVPSQATYLLWLDCSFYTADSLKLRNFIRQKTGLYLSDGGAYGTNGASFLRMNVACPCSRVKDGLARLKKALLLWEQTATDHTLRVPR